MTNDLLLMIFQYKGKGILVVIFAFVPFFGMLILTKCIEEYLFKMKFPEVCYLIAVSIGFIISGFWNRYSSVDYFINKYGEKEIMVFDHKFMFLPMKAWTYIFWMISVIVFICAIVNTINK